MCSHCGRNGFSPYNNGSCSIAQLLSGLAVEKGVVWLNRNHFCMVWALSAWSWYASPVLIPRVHIALYVASTLFPQLLSLQTEATVEICAFIELGTRNCCVEVRSVVQVRGKNVWLLWQFCDSCLFWFQLQIYFEWHQHFIVKFCDLMRLSTWFWNFEAKCASGWSGCNLVVWVQLRGPGRTGPLTTRPWPAEPDLDPRDQTVTSASRLMQPDWHNQTRDQSTCTGLDAPVWLYWVWRSGFGSGCCCTTIVTVGRSQEYNQ